MAKRARKPDNAVKFRELDVNQPFRRDNDPTSGVYVKQGRGTAGAPDGVSVGVGSTTYVWPLPPDEHAAWYAAWRESVGLSPVPDGVTRPTSADIARGAAEADEPVVLPPGFGVRAEPAGPDVAAPAVEVGGTIGYRSDAGLVAGDIAAGVVRLSATYPDLPRQVAAALAASQTGAS